MLFRTGIRLNQAKLAWSQHHGGWIEESATVSEAVLSKNDSKGDAGDLRRREQSRPRGVADVEERL
ncbi:hypothetical protein EV217_2485 [Phyllobacterium myrsinacearum]|nr:hypothetical protein EV217_2485 [Phyllobacterium myrsinacearum]